MPMFVFGTMYVKGDMPHRAIIRLKTDSSVVIDIIPGKWGIIISPGEGVYHAQVISPPDGPDFDSDSGRLPPIRLHRFIPWESVLDIKLRYNTPLPVLPAKDSTYQARDLATELAELGEVLRSKERESEAKQLSLFEDDEDEEAPEGEEAPTERGN